MAINDIAAPRIYASFYYDYNGVKIGEKDYPKIIEFLPECFLPNQNLRFPIHRAGRKMTLLDAHSYPITMDVVVAEIAPNSLQFYKHASFFDAGSQEEFDARMNTNEFINIIYKITSPEAKYLVTNSVSERTARANVNYEFKIKLGDNASDDIYEFHLIPTSSFETPFEAPLGEMKATTYTLNFDLATILVR